MRGTVDVDPVHDGRSVCNGGYETFVGGVRVGEVVACVGMAKRCAVAGAGVDPQLDECQLYPMHHQFEEMWEGQEVGARYTLYHPLAQQAFR
jgi:hypothetical protein